jgi:hypothetical protein
MDLKHLLTFFGLFSDLVGAFLLSIPMVWDTRAATHTMVRLLRTIRFFLYGNVRRVETPVSQIDEVTHSRIVATGGFFSLLFLVITGRLVQIMVLKNADSPAFFVHDPVLLLIFAMTGALLLGTALYLLVQLPIYFVRSLIWVARGNHERKIGMVGLAVLCLGFILQAWVNVLP